MALFKKKHKDQNVSLLTEAEIQKKLYGEFYAGDEAPRVAAGAGRETYRDTTTVAAPPQEPSAVPVDLFTPPHRDVLIQAPSEVREPRESESVSRHVPLHEFEKKTVPAGGSNAATDMYSRFRYHQSSPTSKISFSWGAITGFFTTVTEFFKGLLDPRRVVARRVLIWGSVALVIFLLFWGVNALNFKRETAMRTRYKIPSESAAQASGTVPAAGAVTPSGTVAERPVVITPVSPKPAAKTVSREVQRTPALPYVIQVVTYPALADAEQIVNSLRRAQLKAFVKESVRPSGRVFYIVHLGGFRTEAEAEAQLVKFRALEVARPFQDAFVKTTS
ncbi:MAG TPA: SPOR domain-containing protein [Candidatus Omnitrophota bacterium]|nr:SPOR domain-containing protein [Candidatus Omnitrophota bacterium]HPS37085.1 SPOR domain-containing protein [Candidatus Omnitrophota bacterium]